MDKIQQAIDNLESAVREFSGNTVTTFNLFINCESVDVNISTRTHKQLSMQGVSMRNVKGDFIKEDE